MTWDSIKRIDSSDDNVSKFVFTKENAVAESVLYKYPTYDRRTVICCSTMSGCPVGCRFCGAGDHFVRSLNSDEIVEQPEHLLQQTGVDPNEIDRLQIMFMSMGEPLLNWTSMKAALRKLYRKYPKAALLISTSGVDHDHVYYQLGRLSNSIPTIGLQFSVLESTDEKRNKLIPYKRKLSLAGIAEKGVKWAETTGRRPFINYCVHEQNNTDADVARLIGLFDPKIWEYTISVVCERDEHIAAANERQRDLASTFMGKLTALGASVRMFDPAGQDDIGGGCGQLWFVQDWMVKNPDKTHKSAGHGLEKVHTPRSLACQNVQ